MFELSQIEHGNLLRGDEATKREMKMGRAFIFGILMLFASQATALDLDAPFESIDGGTLSIGQWRGQPVLVVNTASLCGFVDQYQELQDLYERYRDQGVVVLAVPSDDFRQELSSNAEVKEFCEMQYGITLPMTGITRITGADAHPFYLSLRAETGFRPQWNFNKVLLDRDGAVVATYGAQVSPMSSVITREIERLIK